MTKKIDIEGSGIQLLLFFSCSVEFILLRYTETGNGAEQKDGVLCAF